MSPSPARRARSARRRSTSCAAEPDRYEVVALGASSSVDGWSSRRASASEGRRDRGRRARGEAEATRCPRRRGARRARRARSARRGRRRRRQRRGRVRRAAGHARRPSTAGKRLALANKESLIAAGPVVQRARCDARRRARAGRLRALRGAPVPPGQRPAATGEVARIVLTASGGPFRGRTRAELARRHHRRRAAHPTWSMGPKITVDSSTLMNKGLEVIEAHELFGVELRPASRSSCTRSRSCTRWSSSPMARRSPSSRCPTCACRSATPWPTPTASAPRSGASTGPTLGRLDFEAPDLEAFPCLRPRLRGRAAGRTAPAWLNAANEVAVAAFLDGVIPWIAIADVLSEVLSPA